MNQEKIKDQNCSHETEVYSRVVGFYRPINQWNNGKKEEFHNRVVYKAEVKN